LGEGCGGCDAISREVSSPATGINEVLDSKISSKFLMPEAMKSLPPDQPLVWEDPIERLNMLKPTIWPKSGHKNQIQAIVEEFRIPAIQITIATTTRGTGEVV
jgi:hypothetical protein